MAGEDVTTSLTYAGGEEPLLPMESGATSQLYTAARVAQLTSYSWNVYRYMGDYLHLFGVVVLLAMLYKNKGCRSISRSTQFLYFLVFVTRYLDLFDHSQTAYLVFFKVTYIATSFIILVVFWRNDATYERQKDTCSILILLCPSMTAAVILTNEHSVLELLWTFSRFLEGVAMVPQYVFCYRDRGTLDFAVVLYVLCMGGYRMFYICNWIYKKVQMPQYSDLQSWSAGVLEVMFFVDYLLSRFTGLSLLRAMVLKVDEKINEIQGAVEYKVLGRERLSASNPEEAGTELRQRTRVGRAEDAEVLDV